MTPEVLSQLGENQRFYGDMRFKQLTMLMAGITVFGAGVAQYPTLDLAAHVSARTLLGVTAMLFIATMWVMEIRSTLCFVAQREAAPELWPRPTRTPAQWVNSTNAVLIFHIGLFFGWWWLSLQWGLVTPWLVFTGLIGALLIVFSILSYRHLWTYRQTSSSSDARTK